MPTPAEVQAREGRTHKIIKLINKASDGGSRIDKLDLSHPVHHPSRFLAVNKAKEANESDSDK